MMSEGKAFDTTERNRVKRLPARGKYDRETIYPIVDEALICHVSFMLNGQPCIIPTLHARRGDDILLHGSKASRLLKHAQAGGELAIAITLVDGIVVARSTFHSSMNYRSAVLFGRGRAVEQESERIAALAAFTEHLIPGRWADSRPPTPAEMSATAVVAMRIESASAKVRSGPPGDDVEDYSTDFWSGVVPIRQQVLAPQDDPTLRAGIVAPDYITRYRRPGG
jgi:uncharacterized protein